MAAEPDAEKRIEPLTGMLYPETNETFEAFEGLGNGLQTLINCICGQNSV